MTVLRSLTPAKIEKVKQLLTKHTIRGAAMYGGVSYFTAREIKRGKYEKYKMKENEKQAIPNVLA